MNTRFETSIPSRRTGDIAGAIGGSSALTFIQEIVDTLSPFYGMYKLALDQDELMTSFKLVVEHVKPYYQVNGNERLKETHQPHSGLVDESKVAELVEAHVRRTLWAWYGICELEVRAVGDNAHIKVKFWVEDYVVPQE